MSKRTSRLGSAGMIFGLLLVLSGCASLGPDRNLPPEEKVRIRAQAWADSLLAGELKAAWKFTSPNYREYASEHRYATRVAGSKRWTGAKVAKVSCVGDVCDVQFMVDYTIKRLNISNTRPVDYKWLRVDGQWWLHVPASG